MANSSISARALLKSSRDLSKAYMDLHPFSPTLFLVESPGIEPGSAVFSHIPSLDSIDFLYSVKSLSKITPL